MLFYLCFLSGEICGGDHVAPRVDQTLGLVLVRDEADHAVAHEVARDRVTAQAGHVRAQNAQDLVEELLDKCGQASGLTKTILCSRTRS